MAKRPKVATGKFATKMAFNHATLKHFFFIFSIAALCQMSVNIGADPAAGVQDAIRINSPGVISLNSTESPRATPTPTPQSPCVTKASKLPPTTTTVSTNAISSNSKKVIQELKPVDAVPSVPPPPTPAAITNTSIEEVIQPTSPTKNYLTRFPVVKGQQKPEKAMIVQSTTPNVKTTVTDVKKPHDKVPMASSTMTSSRETVTTKVTTSSVPSSFSSISSSSAKHHYHSTHASHVSQQHQRIPQDYPTNPYVSQSYVDFSRQSATYPVNTAKTPQVHSYKRPSNPPPTHSNPVPPNSLPSFPVQSHENMQHAGYQVMEQPDSFFSVNQLVNNPKAGQYATASMMGSSASLSASKKSSGSKRSSSSSSTSSRYQKQQRIGK